MSILIPQTDTGTTAKNRMTYRSINSEAKRGEYIQDTGCSQTECRAFTRTSHQNCTGPNCDLNL